MTDADPIDIIDDTPGPAHDQPCTNCGVRIRSTDLTSCPKCGWPLAPHPDSVSPERAHPEHESHDVTSPAAESGGADDHALIDLDEPDDVPAPKPAIPPARPTPSATTAAATPRRSMDEGAIVVIGHAGGFRIALALAATCSIVLAVAYLWGVGGLFPRQAGLFRDATGEFTAETVRWSDRAVDLVRFLIQRTVLWAAAIAGLWAFSTLRRASVPDWPAAAARMAAIAVATALVTMIELPNRPLEMTIEIVLQAGLFVGLAVVWFRLAFVDGLQLLGMTALGFVLVHLGALLVVWATGTAIM